MFEEKQNDSTPSIDINSLGNMDKNNQINLSENKDVKVSDISVHTMKKDLENINNPEYFVDSPLPKKEAPVATIQISSEKQGTSPFLSQESKKIAENKEVTVKKKSADHHGLNWGKISMIAVSIFIIFMAAGGGYYYWLTRQNSKTEIVEAPPVIPEPTPEISTKNPNYLNIDIDTWDSARIKEEIKIYANKPLTSDSPAEFVVADLQNNPIAFEKFAQKIGFNFSPQIFSSLAEKFSLFVYSDNGKTRLGISINIKDAENAITLKDNLTKEETTLDAELEPLFITTSQYQIDKVKTFSDSQYGGADIRYKNIISPEELSVDYAIFQNKLVIGTTKMTERAIIDYVSSHPDVQGAEDILEDIQN
ncbi:MAG TPA: hypothetical protein PLK35_01190 [Candidatus Moranbacteria bacterium]|nr:hypothetical protein [Candidatus Moranbacteria bacterium]